MKNDGIVECQDAAGDYPGPGDSLSLIRPAQARLGQSDVRRHLGGGEIDWRVERRGGTQSTNSHCTTDTPYVCSSFGSYFLPLKILVASKDFSH